MATTSSISVFNPETNLWHSVYCHWDGYLSHNGKILFEHYPIIDLALKLVSEGDISVLAPSCDKPDGHTFDDPVKGYCIYYGRDRGEKQTKQWIGEEIDLALSPKFGQDYNYWFKDGNWYCLEYQNGEIPLSKECFDSIED